MTDSLTLFSVVLLLYLFECFFWIRKHSIAFVFTRRGRCRISTPAFGSSNAGFVLFNPLSVPGGVFLSHLSPLSVSPAGICAFNPQSFSSVNRPIQNGITMSFDQIVDSTFDGASVLVNNQPFVSCASVAQARSISKLINSAAKASEKKRESIIASYVQQQYAESNADVTLSRARLAIRPIQWTCSALFLFLFVVTPILVLAFGLLQTLIPVAVVMFAFAFCIAFMFRRVRKELFPDDPRWDQVFTLLVCPPASIRAPDLLTKDLLSTYSPVVLASLLCGSRAKAFVRSFVLDLKHPLRHEISDALSSEIISWWSTQQLAHCLAYVTKTVSFSDAVLSGAPSESSTAFCPRCECEFSVATGECPDCPGIELVASSDYSQTVGG